MSTIESASKVATAQLERDREHVHLKLAGKDIGVVALRGREALSALFEMELCCRVEADMAPPATLIGQLACLTLHDGFGVERSLHGVIAEASRRVFDDSGAELRLLLRPQVFGLTLGRDSRVFNDMSVPQIVDRVLQRCPQAAHRWELSDNYPPRIYTAQYREDDWSLISRLLEDEGIYYWFDHQDEQSVLVLTDDSRRAAELPGGGRIRYAIERGMLGSYEVIEELGSEAHTSATKFTVDSFDPERPMLKLSATEGDGAAEMRDASGGGPRDPAQCQRRALIRLEAARARRAGVSGSSSSIRLVPGTVAIIEDHPALDGRYLLTETRYDIRQGRQFDAGAKGGYRCWFEAIEAATRHRPAEDTPVAEQAGLQSGRVVGPAGEEIHTDAKGRVRVQLHWDREGAWDDAAGKWMRVAQRGSASSMLLPRTGWNVLTFMEEGAVDAPSVLSRLHDAEHPPAYKLPDNKTRTVFKTATSPGAGSFNEIRYEDKGGMQEMFLNASKDMNITVQDTRSYNVSHDQERKIGNDQTITITDDWQESITNDQKTSVGGNETLEIGGDRQKDVGGDESDEIGGNRKVKVGLHLNTVVQQSRKLQVGGSLLEKTTGMMELSAAATTIDVGGALVRQSDGIISEDIGGATIQLIAGARLELCGENRVLNVSKRFDENIKGSLLMKSNAKLMDGSDTETSWTVGGALSGKAPHIHIEAKDKIELLCGGSSITIDTEQVTVKALSYDLSNAAEVVATTGVIKHN